MVYVSSALVAIVLCGIFDSVHSSCSHGTFLHRRITNLNRRQEGEAAKKTVEVAKFGYIGNQGPTQWAALAPENIGCATNTVQSPIDITNQTSTLVAPGALAIEFVDVAAAEFENIGTTVEVVMEGKGSKTTADGKVFELKQFHFHTPSEHTIDGEYFPLEAHFVHEAEDKTIAVIAAQFQLSEGGETTELIKGIMDKIGEISTPGTVAETGALAFGPLIQALAGQSLHSYTGSLTTPPCAEGLKFFVTTQQLPLDVATFNKVKAVVGFNSRFTQNAAGSPNLLSLSPAVLVAGAAAAPAALGAPSAPPPATEAPPAITPAAQPAPSAAPPPAEKAAILAPEPQPAEGESKVSTIQAESSGDVNEIVKGLTGIDLTEIL